MTRATKAELLDLAARVEAAQGADRILDCQIAHAVGFRPAPVSRLRELQDTPAYTASLDAALTLVPEGWGITLSKHWIVADGKPRWLAALRGGLGNLHSECEEAMSGALALVAAALRARAEEISDAG